MKNQQALKTALVGMPTGNQQALLAEILGCFDDLSEGELRHAIRMARPDVFEKEKKMSGALRHLVGDEELMRIIL